MNHKLLVAFAAAALAILQTTPSSAGDLDQLLVAEEPRPMSKSEAYTEFVPLYRSPPDCEQGPNPVPCTSRSICRNTACKGPSDPICEVMGCRACLYDVATRFGKCSGGT